MPSGKGARERRRLNRLCLQHDWPDTNASLDGTVEPLSNETSLDVLDASHSLVRGDAAGQAPAESGEASVGRRTAATDAHGDAPARLDQTDESTAQKSTKVPQLNSGEVFKALKQWGEYNHLHDAQTRGGRAKTSADSRAETQEQAQEAAAFEEDSLGRPQQPGVPPASSQTNRSSPCSEGSIHGVISIPAPSVTSSASA